MRKWCHFSCFCTDQLSVRLISEIKMSSEVTGTPVAACYLELQYVWHEIHTQWHQIYRHSANVFLWYHVGLFYNHGTIFLLLYTLGLLIIGAPSVMKPKYIPFCVCVCLFPPCYEGLRSLATMYMTNPQVPYSLMLIEICEWMFWVEVCERTATPLRVQVCP